MSHQQTKRPGEVAVEVRTGQDASLQFIGRIQTPWQRREDCPRQGDPQGPECRIEVFAPWDQALAGLEALTQLEVLYWLDQSRRDLVLQCPKGRDAPVGTFALRSPVRPNPIGSSTVALVAVEGGVLRVRGLDCVDGTPLLDLKPIRGASTTRCDAGGQICDAN
ncbi:tRNA (N6-threonylcarbamoyladenosine(37)-N6)-methyltransferase TrmO [Halochromatium glycolicum]|jgi:tRNA-Thr(GGU) m(6)t(6)A37 methyltransferase TsaA|uniref:tRNA (N6-threonylcarbamoyladenosine(37)-N6)-methyltransferase TrmO n=1 Tax=Halochromatium glycolicum TaxID=85075 RepID=A0AAJ0U8C1_9GAMM|nr:tRNA (N6-threonylcarbamoyladenosine(37)-N6)-methyltransferase TrmO [Halochromatium glycolicum]MBK1707068.1 tRNA (N6-threonylcarbamoyladenosine(37)-N6)-methyltransferase TrmO [Halochromatium glycolicum]